MTEKSIDKAGFSRKLPSGLSSFHLEADRAASGLRITVTGIIGISELDGNGILLLSHGGRIYISGEQLKIEIYENKTVEICGRIGEISFGKNKN